MQIEKVEPENRIEGFVRKFDAPDWRDPELNLYLTLTRATDPAPPEKPRPPYVDPYDDPYPLFRKVPRKPDPSPPIVKLQHIAPKTILYVDPKPMQSMVTDVLRNYGEHPLYLKTTHERDYQEAVACFQLRCAVVQWPDKHVPKMDEKTYNAMVELAAKHLTLEDCPAQETVQLQITVQAAFHFAIRELDEDNQKKKAELDSLTDLIVNTMVIDVRKFYETAEALRERVTHYLTLYNKRIDPFSVSEDDEAVMKAEIDAALESVFPRKGFLYFMDLPKEEKVLQLQELAEVVTGIRVFNKFNMRGVWGSRYQGKGGHTLQLPFEPYENQAVELGDQVHDTMIRLNENVHGYSIGIMIYYQDMGTNHMFIKRLRDELAYNYQAGVYLEAFNRFLFERHEVVSNLLDKCAQHLERVVEIIGSYAIIPSDMVFPELRAVGAIQSTIAEEVQCLQARVKAAAPLLRMANLPSYRPSPTTEKRLEIKQKNFLFLPRDPPFEDETRFEVDPDECNAVLVPPDKLHEILDKGTTIEYSGFCPVCFVRNGGILWKGDPCLGLVQTKDMKLYSCGDDDSKERFLKAPCKYIADVTKLVRDMPQYVHILNLQSTPAFNYLSIPKILEAEIVNKAVPKDFSTQTDVHPWIPIWDREKLHRRKLELQTKRTHCTQTDISHFRRDNVSQTWPPKQKWTNTGISRFTDMPRHVKVLHNLRGDVHTKMHICQAKYEHTAVYNPWKVVLPFEPITEPKC